MATALRPIRHEDRLSLVEHLDELRSRIVICGITLAIAFGICFWQNGALLSVLNQPLQDSSTIVTNGGRLSQTARQATLQAKALAQLGHAVDTLASGTEGLQPRAKVNFEAQLRAYRATIAQLPSAIPKRQPVTLGVGEPFTTTITVTLYFALIISLPVILYELYGFIMPALAPNERRAARPLLTAVPVLFAAGVLFGYFVVLPAAVRFFVNFNSGQFNVLVQASQFYSFAATILLAMGVVFQVPVLILGATRLGLVTPRQLRRSRRYALLACAVIAALLPGDAITLVLETVPLYVLYEASILLARFVTPPEEGVADEHAEARRHPSQDQPPQPEEPQPTVQQMIDHVDPKHTD
jgi:sec-independent protein translocase protein TatC